MRPWQVLLLFFVGIIAFIIAKRRATNRARLTGARGLPTRAWVGIAAIGLVVIVALMSTARVETQPATPTAPTVALADSDYQTVDVRDLKKNPDAYKSKPIQLNGEVFNIREQNGKTFLQMWVAIPGGTQFDREAVAVNYAGVLPNVYEKTKITTFGIGSGTDSGTNAFGATSTQPAIRADRVTITQ